jgi:hypothetical protein
MINAKLPSGEEVEINAAASDVEFIQMLIAFNENIAREINNQAYGLINNAGAEKLAESFNQLKAMVADMHAFLSKASITHTK